MSPCTTCRHHRPVGGLCTRPITLADDVELKAPRSTFHERDEKSALWKKIKRKGGDCCGKQGRHWVST